MKKLLGVLLAFLLLVQAGSCLDSYFCLTNTSGQGAIDDPAKAICNKYGEGKMLIYYGLPVRGTIVAVCAFESNTPPDYTEIVVSKSRSQILTLSMEALPQFNGTNFIYIWENPKS